jgi:hypothetical protein
MLSYAMLCYVMLLQDVFDAAAYRSFISPYAEPDYSNSSSSSSSSGSSSLLDRESGEVALYARDYREIGRWLPDDASYVIGK